MPHHQIEIVIQADKNEEFLDSMQALSRDCQRDKGCSAYRVYQDFNKDNVFYIVGEFETRKAMENYFRSRNFEVLLGAAVTLGEEFKITISQVLETGGVELAKSKIASWDG